MDNIGNPVSATATVVRGGNRRAVVLVPVVCRYPGGAVKYEGYAKMDLAIPAGDELPAFEVAGAVACEVLGDD